MKSFFSYLTEEEGLDALPGGGMPDMGGDMGGMSDMGGGMPPMPSGGGMPPMSDPTMGGGMGDPAAAQGAANEPPKEYKTSSVWDVMSKILDKSNKSKNSKN